MSSLSDFLSTFKSPKGKEHTHTNLNGGSYYIPDTALTNFYKHYTRVFGSQGDIPMHLSEKHVKSMSPLLIDLDFRQYQPHRMYDKSDMIQRFIETYHKYVTQYIEITSKVDTTYYLLEKGTAPRDSSNGVYKDGVHIIAPHIATPTDVQFLIRTQFINNEPEFFAKEGFCNPIDDIIDEAVIERNNWLMYGSNKPSDDNNRYLVTHAVSVYPKLQVTPITDPWESKYIQLFSIRNKESLRIIKQDMKPEESIASSSATTRKDTVATELKLQDDCDMAEELVDILDPKRADDYHSWLYVGITLYNINSVHLLDKWIEFSKQSYKYQPGVCEEKWSSFSQKAKPMGMGTLKKWAMQDSPEEYKQITENNILFYILKSCTGCNADVGVAIHQIIGDRFVCTNTKSQHWYEFKNHRWNESPDGVELRKVIMQEASKIYLDVAARYLNHARIITNTDEQKRYTEKAHEFSAISLKLKNVSFIDQVMRILSWLCFDAKFLSKLDQHPHLIGFENGVYDLDAKQFRDGLPDDHIYNTTGYNYISQVIPQVRDFILEFLHMIQPSIENTEYLIKTMAYMLHGTKYLEQFWFWTGNTGKNNGRNGKGSLSTLLGKTLGNYYYEPDITIVTSIKKSSSGPTPEMNKAKGKRVLCATEPDDSTPDGQFRVNKLKQLRGNDLIQTRALYQDCIEFKPQFGMVFQMNEKPELSKADNAIAITLRIIEFPYQFVDNPTESYQKQACTNLKARFETDPAYWQQFMLILLEYYNKYIYGKQQLPAPPSVMEAVKEYIDDNNPVSVWLKSHYQVTQESTDRVLVEDLYTDFKYGTDERNITKKKFGGYMSLLGFKSVPILSKRYYVGLKELQDPDGDGMV